MTDLCGDFMMFHCISTGQFTCWTQKQGGLEDDVPSVVGWVLGSSGWFSGVQLSTEKFNSLFGLQAQAVFFFFFRKKTPEPPVQWSEKKWATHGGEITVDTRLFKAIYSHVWLDPVPIGSTSSTKRTEILSKKKKSKQEVNLRQTIRNFEWLGDRFWDPTCQVSSNVFWFW